MIRKIKNIFHKFEAVLSNLIFSFPAKDMFVIGVTGTDGKSTTSYFLYQILVHNGKKAAYIGTTGTIINNKHQPLGLHVTTPSTFTLQKLVKKAKEGHSDFLVLEVTSHGLDQFRVWGIPFQIGLLTNVTPEHLDYHKTLDNYARTKIKLLQIARICIVGDDEGGFVQKYLHHKDVTRYGVGKDSQIDPTLFKIPQDMTKFNQKNLLGAIAAARYTGLTDQQINSSLKNLHLPKARFDTVYKGDFKVIIDFAHTPASFKNLLPEVKKSTKGRLIHVFGSAGGRDKKKRSEMGRIASEHDDIIVLTAEDPRKESAKHINTQIKSGILDFEEKSANTPLAKKTLFDIPKREEAIEFAISNAKKGDTILLTGKGHERSINIQGTEHPWDEYMAVEKALLKK